MEGCEKDSIVDLKQNYNKNNDRLWTKISIVLFTQ